MRSSIRVFGKCYGSILLFTQVNLFFISNGKISLTTSSAIPIVKLPNTRVCPSVVRWVVGSLIGRSAFYNFLQEGREVTLPCSFRKHMFVLWSVNAPVEEAWRLLKSCKIRKYFLTCLYVRGNSAHDLRLINCNRFNYLVINSFFFQFDC